MFLDSETYSCFMKFSWIDEGKVAGCRGVRSQSDLEFLVTMGINSLVRLAPEIDMASMQVESVGLEDVFEPVKDWAAPTQDQIARIILYINNAMAVGKSVAVSCNAGQGRTGTILACYLISNGLGAAEALDLLVTKRPLSREVLNNAEQVFAIEEFAKRIRIGEIKM